ncbi:MAG: hypothetical protein WDM77_07550 [Steroidobacteraceae bacterium]
MTLQIVEARFGVVRLAGHTLVSNARLEHLVQDTQAPGSPVNANALDRALLLLGDLPGVIAKGRLEQGQNQAGTDLVVDLTDGPRFSGDVASRQRRVAFHRQRACDGRCQP